MKFAICNEMFWTEDQESPGKEKWSVRRQFEAAAEMGYDGIEISPFTLNFDVREITDEQKQEIADAARDTGLEVAGIHWLLSHTEGYHVTDPDPEVRERSVAYMEDLVRFGVEIGGGMMVVGSPQQRRIKEGVSHDQAWEWFSECMRRCGEVGAGADFKICIEPLATATNNNFIYRAEEGRKMAAEIDMPNVGIILDTFSGLQEETDLPGEIRKSKGPLYHYHCNDANMRAPGWGDTDFVPLLRALLDIGYDRFASIEVFDFEPDAYEHAKKGVDTLRTALAEAQGRS